MQSQVAVQAAWQLTCTQSGTAAQRTHMSQSSRRVQTQRRAGLRVKGAVLPPAPVGAASSDAPRPATTVNRYQRPLGTTRSVETAAGTELPTVQPSTRVSRTDTPRHVFCGSAASAGGAARRWPVGKRHCGHTHPPGRFTTPAQRRSSLCPQSKSLSLVSGAHQGPSQRRCA